MRKVLAVGLLVILAGLTASAAKKETGTTALKDFQPAGTTGKDHKHQQYDISFVTSTHQYTCRTPEKKSLNATDWVVGSQINYQIEGNKGKVKSSTGKEVNCMIVRVADLAATQ